MGALTKSQKLLRFPQVKELVGLSRSQIWRLEQQGHFPRRVQISNRAVGWKSGQIEEFINSRAAVKREANSED
ncbi:MAG: AlpA family phage regulatory protein [Pseudomonadales bacterium]|nr:AlpA family phage regulatory protein [Pseudomonadales bacterium]